MMFFVPRRTRARAGPDPAPAPACAARLLQRVAQGDASALAALYEREAASVYRYVLALCGNAAWAADATQEAFVALATRPQGFDPARGQIGAYLAGVARHALAAHWRELRVLVPLPESDDESPNGMHGPGLPPDRHAPATPEHRLVQRQDLQALWAALRALPVAFREAVVLVDLQERPYLEAAQIAGVELNTLRTRLHRGRARLAALLSPREGD